MLNWIAWNRNVDIKTVITLNWNVWNDTIYLYIDGFGIKYAKKVDMP